MPLSKNIIKKNKNLLVKYGFLQYFICMELKKQAQKGTIISEKFIEPENYRVILLNDDFTPMDFVVAVLISIFNKSQDEAETLMFKVHKTGQASVGIYVYDIATTKCFQVLTAAKNNNFPLQCKVEKV